VVRRSLSTKKPEMWITCSFHNSGYGKLTGGRRDAGKTISGEDKRREIGKGDIKEKKGSCLERVEKLNGEGGAMRESRNLSTGTPGKEGKGYEKKIRRGGGRERRIPPTHDPTMRGSTLVRFKTQPMEENQASIPCGVKERRKIRAAKPKTIEGERISSRSKGGDSIKGGKRKKGGDRTCLSP